jgi:hypothetical protein
MLRVYKSYHLPYRIGGRSMNATQPVAALRMTFPSYPAVPFSLDDFYQTSAGMVVFSVVGANAGRRYLRTPQVITETTIANHNSSLWQRLSPRTLLDWVRNMVANRLSSSGPEWMDIYKQYNSGT